MERRGSGRLAISNEASIVTKDGYFSAVLENISTGGLFLRTNKCIEIGDKIEITIPLPGSPDNKNLIVNVVAVRIMDTGVAFKFVDIDENAQSMLFHLTSGGNA
jgi:Tfp pilus assembly protein PilZ